ncbi:dienelactone hydrolase family protein [Leifsonia sp. Leaf264]|uniref:dienelactone hydrolase family protein n=1 Tax=Leifsonia sp. Leaf264 TaxID=1736314 RepID=UPI0006F58D6A|nr:dienelactone hydrolase family protein [Leifsonia sp. Leaf264]KQP01819.1 hypothetical protein ASF30_04415 [Leifsonia sp. Leaf264]
MSQLASRDVVYSHADIRMIGRLSSPADGVGLPGVLLIHDAFGLGADMAAIADRYAELGYAVFAADVWGERLEPTSGQEIGGLIGGMASDRAAWMGRIRAAHIAAAAQPEVAADRIAIAGYCFGGSSALEYLRTGGDVLGVVSIHGGLDLVEGDWSDPTSSTRVLLCTGADDPMAAPQHWQPIKAGLTTAGIDWEFDLYSGTRHAFTNPKADGLGIPGAAYNARSSARAWARTVAFLDELFTTESTTSSCDA